MHGFMNIKHSILARQFPDDIANCIFPNTGSYMLIYTPS